MTEGLGFAPDGILKDNLERMKGALDLDWDMVIVYDGVEGSGKTTKAFQDAVYLDHTFRDSLDRVVFTPKQLLEAINTAQPKQAIVFDEAFTGMFARDHATSITKVIIKKFSMIRKKRLVILLCMPSIFEMEKYMALHRTRALIHVGYKDFNDRGYFYFYNWERKKDLYIQGKKFYSYAHPSPNFYGRFPKYFPFDKDKYDAKKEQAIQGVEGDNKDAELTARAQEVIWERMLNLKADVPLTTRLEILQMSQASYYRKLRKETNDIQI